MCFIFVFSNQEVTLWTLKFKFSDWLRFFHHHHGVIVDPWVCGWSSLLGATQQEDAPSVVNSVTIVVVSCAKLFQLWSWSCKHMTSFRRCIDVNNVVTTLKRRHVPNGNLRKSYIPGRFWNILNADVKKLFLFFLFFFWDHI